MKDYMNRRYKFVDRATSSCILEHLPIVRYYSRVSMTGYCVVNTTGSDGEIERPNAAVRLCISDPNNESQ
jgi:hypothetical protein